MLRAIGAVAWLRRVRRGQRPCHALVIGADAAPISGRSAGLDRYLRPVRLPATAETEEERWGIPRLRGSSFSGGARGADFAGGAGRSRMLQRARGRGGAVRAVDMLDEEGAPWRMFIT